MKTFVTALKLFSIKQPNEEIVSIGRTLSTWFQVETNNGSTYSVDITNNKVDRIYNNDPWQGIL